MDLTNLGHAALLVSDGSHRILIDPGIYSTDWWDVDAIDVILVTHGHHDHLDRENIGRILHASPECRLVAPHDVTEMLEVEGFESEAIGVGDVLATGAMRIEALGGFHAVVHPRIPRMANLGYLISAGSGERVFHPGDSYEVTPPGVDTLALPITAPWAQLAATADFLAQVRPASALPMHDAALTEIGRATYRRLLGELVPEVPIHWG